MTWPKYDHARLQLHLTLFWVAVTPIAMVFWSDSIPWINFISMYAIVGTHWGAYEAARAARKVKREGLDAVPGGDADPARAGRGGVHSVGRSDAVGGGDMAGDYTPMLKFRYTNHEGVTADRCVRNPRLWYGHSPHHPDVHEAWYLVAEDFHRDFAERHFLLSDLLPPPANDAGLTYAGVPRSPHWRKVREAFLVGNPSCAACGVKRLLNVHHVVPFHVDPTLELDAANLVTLCETPSHNCHFLLGHLLDWKAHNPDVRADAASMLAKIGARAYG